jgi:hypothetical protein
MKMVTAREEEMSNHLGETKSEICVNEEWSLDEKIVRSKGPNEEHKRKEGELGKEIADREKRKQEAMIKKAKE